MKAILVMSLLALSFATGFTCSKNPPQEAAPAATSTEAAPQEQMAAPAADAGAPAADQPAAGGTEAAPSGEHK